MAVTLGKDCSVSIGGNIVGVRNVTIGYTARTVDVNAWGSNLVESYSVAYDAFATVETNDAAASSGYLSSLASGAFLTISGGAAGFSFDGIVTSVTETDPIDGVATLVIEAKQGRNI